MQERRVLASAFTCCPPGTPGFTGGEDTLGWNLVNQIARSNELWVLTQAEDRSSIEQTLTAESKATLHFVYVDLPRWLHPMLRYQGSHQVYYYLWQWKAFFAARRLHKQIGFDLFHHITYANDWMASFIGAFLPIPYVRGPGGGAHSTPASLRQEYSLGGRIWERIRSAGQWIFRHDPMFLKGQGRASSILVCNTEALDAIPKRWSHKAHLFPVNGISSEDLMPAVSRSDDRDCFRVLSAGTLIKVKGFGLTIKAFREFAGRNANCSLSIVGSGPDESRLMEIVRDAQLESKVHFLGWMPRNELRSEMAACDVFLFPSLRDGGGGVVVEAMAAGKPVICLDLSGPGMHVTSECGVKIEPGRPNQVVRDLAAALERLKNDSELRQRLGSAARERAQAEYHWDNLGERLTQFYPHSIGRENGGRGK